MHIIKQRRVRAIALWLALWTLAGCMPAIPTAVEEPIISEPAATHEELAQHYAPIIYQGAASDADYITATDFDGDWIGNNNWENQPSGDLSAYVYYSVAETNSHWFLFYSLYHPRDYTEEPCEKSDGCHENDMESLQVVIAKDGTTYGRLQAMLTLAHSHIYLYPSDDSVKKGALRPDGRVQLVEDHPAVWVELYGHGIYGRPAILVPGKITYRVGDRAEIPEDIHDEDVAYELLSIYDTLWQHRAEIGSGQMFDNPFAYHGQILPASFDGENWGQDKANPPWAYNQEIDHSLLRGDFFLDPAKALAYFATLQGELSHTYVYNPFLVDLGLEISSQ